MSIWIATIGALDGSNTPKTLYFSDVSYIDNDGNYFENRMLQPALIKVSPDDGGTFKIFSTPSIGEIQLINKDGGLNYLMDYALDNGSISLSLVVDNGTKNDYLTGKIESMRFSGDAVYLTVRSMSEVLTRNHVNNKFLGNNALPNGVEGVADDIKGNVKPRVFGSVLNATPVLVNTSQLIYQFSDRTTATISAIYDKGVALTLHQSYTWANFASFMAHTSIASGKYIICAGYVKLGTTPAGTVTGDCSDAILIATSNTSFTVGVGSKTFATQAGKVFSAGNTLIIYSAANQSNFMTGTVASYATTSLVMNITSVGGSGTFADWVISSCLAGDVFEAILTEESLTLNGAAKTTLNAIGAVGIYVTGETTTTQLLNQIAQSCGAYWYFLQNTVYAKLLALATTSTLSLTNSELITIDIVNTGLGENGLPVESISFNYDHIETVQKETDLAGSVTTARKAVLSNQYRSKFINDAAVKTRHPLAPAIKIDSCLRLEANATTVATTLLNLSKVRVDTVNITAVVDEIPSLQLGDGVMVFSDKLSYDYGKLLTIIGFQIDAKRKEIVLECIG
jgi:hypothetical protein